MKGITGLFILVLVLFFQKLKAQDIDSLKHSAKDKRSFLFTYENDLFSGSDRYYTQGIVLEFKHPAFKKSLLSKLLLDLNDSRNSVYGLTLRQDVFTPKSIRNASLDSADRPYASTIFLSQTLVSKSFTDKLSTSLDLGFIGPIAFGEQEQKFIHAHTNNAAPLGWENQVPNSFIANYNLWIERGFFISKWFDVFGELGGKAGLLNTNGSGGILIRMGKKRNYLPQHHLKPMPKFELYTTANGTASYVFYNTALQGLPWKYNIHVLSPNQIERIVYKLTTSITVSIKKVSFTYSQAFLTPEIKGGLHHSWGSCNFMFLF